MKIGSDRGRPDPPDAGKRKDSAPSSSRHRAKQQTSERLVTAQSVYKALRSGSVAAPPSSPAASERRQEVIEAAYELARAERAHAEAHKPPAFLAGAWEGIKGRLGPAKGMGHEQKTGPRVTRADGRPVKSALVGRPAAAAAKNHRRVSFEQDASAPLAPAAPAVDGTKAPAPRNGGKTLDGLASDRGGGS